mgnify:FL=1
MLHKCEGIVIRTNHYGETNKIVTLFTRELGKVGVMARGAKKPSSRLSAVSQLFCYGHYLFQRGKGLGSLQQGEIIHSMRSIKEDIFLTAYCSYIVELTDKATEEAKPNPYLFEFLLLTLQNMEEGVDPEILMFIYEMKMLSVLGIAPELSKCTTCGTTEGTFSFSIAEGGFICQRCVHKDKYAKHVSPSTLKLLRIFYFYDLHKIGNVSVKEETRKQIRSIIDEYYETYSGILIKSKKFIKQMTSFQDAFKKED